MAQAQFIGALAGFLFSQGDGENVNLAGTIARSAFENNYLTHEQFSMMIDKFEACGNDNQCKREVLLEYRELTLEQEHALAQCGGDIACLSDKIVDLKGTLFSDKISEFFSNPELLDIDDPDIQLLLKQINAVQHTALTTYGLLPDDPNAGAFFYVYSQYPDWSSQNCIGKSGADCMAAFQTYEVHGLGGLVHQYHTEGSAKSIYTLALGGAALAATPAALAALAKCTSSMVCLNELSITLGELALGLSGATAGQTFISVGAVGTAVAGRIVMKHGDEIITVIDDFGRSYKPVSQNLDDQGHFLLETSDGLTGYLDEVGKFLVTKVPDEKLTPIHNPIDLTNGKSGHILSYHGSGTGKSGKSEFPVNWGDKRIIHQVSDVAFDATLVKQIDPRGTPYVVGVRDGIEIRVNFFPDNHVRAGEITTAYPINVPVNP